MHQHNQKFLFKQPIRIACTFLAVLLAIMVTGQALAADGDSCNPNLDFNVAGSGPIFLGDTIRISANLGARDIKGGSYQDIYAFGYALNCHIGEDFANCTSEGNTVEFIGNLTTDCKRPDGSDVELNFPEDNVIEINTVGGPIRTGPNQQCNVQFDAKIIALAPQDDNIIVQAMGWPVSGWPSTNCSNGLTSAASSTLGLVVRDCAIDLQKEVSVDNVNWFAADSPDVAPSLLLGGTAYYRLIVSNTGTADIVQPIAIMDSALDIDTTIPALGAGEQVTLTGQQIENLTKTGRCQVVGSLQNTASAGAVCRIGDPGITAGASDSAYLVCTGEPAVDIEKATNGEDADTPTGPQIPVGGAVTWTYVVTNTGSLPLTNVAVVDSDIGAVTCPENALAVGASMICTANGTATLGQYANLGTVNADSDSGAVTDSDPSHYLGVAASVDIEKATNGEDADTPTGPQIPVGGAVTWTYVVTNTGSLPLTNVAVVDSDIGAVTCPENALAVGASMTCTANGTATLGQYANVGTVNADSDSGAVTDSDPSHYLGVEAAVDIEKATNGEDADTPTGPQIPVGGAVTWTYVVTNTGSLPLTNVAVVDSDIGAVTCPENALAVGASMICAANGTATLGQYANVGTVNADSDSGAVTDSDPSHYLGIEAAVDIEKATNGEDADTPTGPQIPVGGAVTWTYVVTNTGSLPLTNVAVIDSDIGAVTCPENALAVGASMICTANGTATLGQYANLGTVNADSDSGAVTDSDPSHYFGTGDGRIVIVKEISVDGGTTWFDANDVGSAAIAVYPSDALYRFTVTNNGTAPLKDVVVDDSELGITGVDEYVIGNLAVGQTVVITSNEEPRLYVESRCEGRGTYLNTAVASGLSAETDAPVSDDDSAVLKCIGEPHITILKEISPTGDDPWFDDQTTPQEYPSDAWYRISVTNDGTAPLENVEVIDGDISVLEEIGNLAVGQTVVLTAGQVTNLYQQDRCTGSGTVGNLASASGNSVDDPADTVDDSDSATLVCVGSPAITLVKEISVDNQNWSDANTEGEAVMIQAPSDAWYRITVTNTGLVDMTNVVVNDGTLGIFDYLVGDLASGQQVILTSGEIPALYYPDRCTGKGTFGNSANVQGTSVETGSQSNASDEAWLECTGTPDIQIVKEISVNGGATWFFNSTPSQMPPSDALYRLTVTNTGTSDLDGVVVNDAQLGIVDFPVGYLAVDETVVLTQGEIPELFQADRCTVTGSFVNTASSSGVSLEYPYGSVNDSDSATLVCQGVVDICAVSGRPTLLKLEYNGTYDSANNQGDAPIITPDGTGPIPVSPVTVELYDKNTLEATHVGVTVGTPFNIYGSWTPSGKIPPNIKVVVKDGNTVLQTIIFHGSCSAPLVISDQFGAVTIIGYTP